MKVLLISANVASTPYSVYPLGMSMVAAALQNAGHEVAQFDFLHAQMSATAISETIAETDPEIVGISIRNIDNVNLMNEKKYIDAVDIIVKEIRKHTKAPVILGGSGFSIMPEVIMRKVGADYGIVGEGESEMVKFTDNASRGIYPDNPWIRASQRLFGNEIPSAVYDPRLMSFYLKRGNIATVQTKRGCTHRCVYCSYPNLEGAVIRCREPRAVVDDIQTLVEGYKASYIFFADSVFNDDQGYYLDVVGEMLRRNIHVPWSAFFKPEGLDDESMSLMKQTGLVSAEIGADAATDKTLRHLGKSFLFHDIVRCNDLFAKYGIGTAHFYMFGGPGETQQTVLEGIENIKNMKRTVSFIYMGIRILPDTGLARTAVKQGIISLSQELLEPVYYIAPGIDRQWLEKTLSDGFFGIRHCVFPPDFLDSSLQFLHKLGHVGFLWDMVIPDSQKNRRRRRPRR